MVKEFISQLSPDKLTPFETHPYQVREDAAMDELEMAWLEASEKLEGEE